MEVGGGPEWYLISPSIEYRSERSKLTDVVHPGTLFVSPNLLGIAEGHVSAMISSPSSSSAVRS